MNWVPAASKVKLLTLKPSIAENPPVTEADGASVITFSSRVDSLAELPETYEPTHKK